MRRRGFNVLLLLAPLTCKGQQAASLRGKLTTGAKPVLVTSDGRKVSLSGDEDVMKVLADERLNGADFEVAGRAANPGSFTASGIHLQPLFVHKGGKRLNVTYWCDICFIRTYFPGRCVCCQKWTDLDLIEPQP